MGNTPSNQQQQQQQQHRTTPSAPPTPTGAHHQNNNNNSSLSYSIPPPTNTFVDGGYLFPLSNIYPSSQQDWLHPVVQKLILSRRLAPFYRGLEDWEPDWDKQTISHALQSITFSRINAIKQIQKIERQQQNDQSVIIPKNHPSHSITKRFSTKLNNNDQHHSSNSSFSSSSNNNTSSDLPTNPRHLIFEAVLQSQIRSNEVNRYLAQTVECPICFLYYPPNINLSRCCQQPICTECFTQIKRIDPTPQEIKSEPACCPYCVEAHFGVTYEPPPLDQQTDSPSVPNPVNTTPAPTAVPLSNTTSAPPNHRSTINSQSAPTPNPLTDGLESKASSTESPKMKRRQTTSHTSKQVVTTDSIQPDWQAKLEAVKAAVQRRANRRIIFRQEGDRLIPVGITSSRDPSGSAFLAALEQEHSSPSSISRRGLSALMGGAGGTSTHSSSYPTGSGNNGTVRRSRTENSSYGVDLEELMIMEAMRLSLVEEEERKKKAAEEEEKLKNITKAITDNQSNESRRTETLDAPGPSRIIADGDAEENNSFKSQSKDHQAAEVFSSLSHSNLSAGLTSLISTSNSTPTPTGRLNQLLLNPNASELEESRETSPQPIKQETSRFQPDHNTTLSNSPDLMIHQGSTNPTESRPMNEYNNSPPDPTTTCNPDDSSSLPNPPPSFYTSPTVSSSPPSSSSPLKHKLSSTRIASSSSQPFPPTSSLDDEQNHHQLKVVNHSPDHLIPHDPSSSSSSSTLQHSS